MRLAPERISVIGMWFLTSATGVALLLEGVRSSDAYDAVRWTLHTGYVAAMLWFLVRNGPSVEILPALESAPWARRQSRAWMPVLGIALLLVLTAAWDDGFDILMLLLIPATLWILVVWRRKIRLRALIQGVGLALVAYLAGRPLARHGVASETIVVLLPAMTAPMYVAGALLCERTRLGAVRLVSDGYGRSVTSFLRGIVLFLPLGLLNAADGSPGGDSGWLTEWWQPVALPWFSALGEEAWFRLFLIGLCYFLIRPALREHPALAVLAVTLFSGLTFGLGHGRSLERLLTTGLLYGVPMAAAFVRRDYEHAVGAHYAVDFVPWLVVLVET